MKVLAAVAHPDDIEFILAGTLLRLKAAGCEIHMWNLANGCQGTKTYSREQITQMRLKEAGDAAKSIGATYHEPLFDDLHVFYDGPSIARVAAVVREVQPDIILTHYPSDYMEDHQNTCRLMVTAAFSREMTNLTTEPPRPTYHRPLRIYHGMPHGVRDFRGKLVDADAFVDVSGGILETKKAMLEFYRSQQEWLNESQGMPSLGEQMADYCAVVGKLSGKFAHAEGLIRHHHIGFCASDFDPIAALISDHYRLAEKN